MNTGTVKFFNEEKGFGFIVPDSWEKDVFIHKSNLEDTITQDDKVEYTLWESDRWPHAENVKKTD